jgi:hypothetical protein
MSGATPSLVLHHYGVASGDCFLIHKEEEDEAQSLVQRNGGKTGTWIRLSQNIYFIVSALFQSFTVQSCVQQHQNKDTDCVLFLWLLRGQSPCFVHKFQPSSDLIQ